MRLLLLTLGVSFSMMSFACSSDEKPATKPAATSSNGIQYEKSVQTSPGVAGGMTEETITLPAKVTAVDQASRTVTIVGQEGKPATFTVGPEVKNLAQLKPGDSLTVTLKQELVVYVRSGLGEPSDTYAAAVAAAPKGAKPGAVVGESYEMVATVTDIDKTKRVATLKFSDDSTRKVPIRPDVDLDRYKVGDSLVIRATTAVVVLTATPAK